MGGIAVMIGGDANADAVVDTTDKSVWNAQTGMNGYKSADFNLDSQVNNPDKNDILIDNME